MRPYIRVAVLILVTTACFIDPPVLRGQERKAVEASEAGDGQVLRVLLDEVRQLRMALQRSNAVNHRLQITLERVRLQQGRVDSLTRALENVRSRIADLKSARAQMDEQIKYAEGMLERGGEQNRRAEIEQQVKEMKSRLGSWSREEEQLREREAATNGELQGEQAKLDDLYGQLENMVRELERQ